MAQTMVNFRIDEEVKKNMELACKEMGLSMTTAFTIFATKVGKEKRIPFEITAEPRGSAYDQRQRVRTEFRQERGEEEPVNTRKPARLESLCMEVRRSLTSVHTAIPSSITGLPMERIRLLCANELKDKAAGVSKACKSLSPEKLRGKDLSILDEYTAGLSSIAEDLREIERTLIPAMKSWSGGDAGCFVPYEKMLSAISRKFDCLPSVMQRFLCSAADSGGARAVQSRLRRTAASVETAYVLSAVENLGSLILRHYDALDTRTKSRLESDYLRTLELALRELSRAEQNGENVDAKAALCLRAVNVLVQVVSDNRQVRQEWSERSLEAEVAALERLAAMRGDIDGGMKSES